MTPAGSGGATPKPWTTGQALLAGFLALEGLAITVPAFAVIWLTVTHLVRPWFGSWSWTVPACTEIAFTGIYLTGLLLEWRDEPGGWLRPALLTALGSASLWLNVSAAHGIVASAVAHAVVVTTFFGFLLAAKEAVRRLRSRRGRPGRITLAEWLAHPLRSLTLWRWMAAWGERSTARAAMRYNAMLYAIALAQSDARIGHTLLLWRRRLPVTLRYQLGTGKLPPDVERAIVTSYGGVEIWQAPVAAWVDDQLRLLDRRPAGDTSRGSGLNAADGTDRGASDDTKVSGGAFRGARRGRPHGSEWPSARGMSFGELVAQARKPANAYLRRHGKKMPAVNLPAALHLRISRDRAGKVLDAVYGPKQPPAATGVIHLAEKH